MESVCECECECGCGCGLYRSDAKHAGFRREKAKLKTTRRPWVLCGEKVITQHNSYSFAQHLYIFEHYISVV